MARAIATNTTVDVAGLLDFVRPRPVGAGRRRRRSTARAGCCRRSRLVVQIDPVGLQAPQRGIGDLADVFGAPDSPADLPFSS
jgi:hypothetical protein